MTHHHGITIGDLARKADVAASAIRYYEEIGLLPPAMRTAAGHRNYGGADVDRLLFIKRCRAFDFTIPQVRGLVELATATDNDCRAARDLAQDHLGRVREKLSELQKLEQDLERFVDGCETTCVSDPERRCVILEEIEGCCHS